MRCSGTEREQERTVPCKVSTEWETRGMFKLNIHVCKMSKPQIIGAQASPVRMGKMPPAEHESIVESLYAPAAKEPHTQAVRKAVRGSPERKLQAGKRETRASQWWGKQKQRECCHEFHV